MGHESDEKIKDISTVIILSPADVEYTVGFSRLNFPDLFLLWKLSHALRENRIDRNHGKSSFT